jgi:hypothetical protein
MHALGLLKERRVIEVEQSFTSVGWDLAAAAQRPNILCSRDRFTAVHRRAKACRLVQIGIVGVR